MSFKRSTTIRYLGAVTLLLLLAYGLMVSSIVRKSATVDEQSHLFRGAAYLKEGATHFLLGHPILSSAISAVPMLTEPNLRLPVDSPAWTNGDWSVAGDLFLWQINDNPQRLLFLGRLPVIWLTLLLGALVFRWGLELVGTATALLAMALLLLDPNVLANGRLVTGDLPVALFFTLTVYGYWRWANSQGNQPVNLLITGIGLGLAGATKFNAALLLPILGMIALWLVWLRRSWQPLLALLSAGIIGWVVIWLVYGLDVRPLPGGAFWNDLFWELQYFGKPHGTYLAGEYSTEGWWYYFIVTFLLKTPLPTLILLIIAFITYRSSFSISYSRLFLLWPAAAYFGFSLTSSLNIGYRYLLPILPFLFLFAAVTLSRLRWRISVGDEFRIFFAIIWLIFLAVVTWPNYIPYFNLFAAGKGWQILSDSNVDWGQDLPALAEWQETQAQTLKLSYFGMAHPSAYGIQFEPLPTWEPGPEQGNQALQPLYPPYPAPGLYAISITNLHGVVLGTNRDTFAWFRDKEPVARLGNSIFIYDVPTHGLPTDLVLSGLRPAQLVPEMYANLRTNDVQVRWFDAATSFIWPQDGGWLAVPIDVQRDPALVEFWPETAVFTDTDQTLYQLSKPPLLPWADSEVKLDGAVTFLGYQGLDGKPGEVSLLTAWKVIGAVERPLKIFVHALDENARIIGQWDGLDVDSTSWLSGDVFVQFHRFVIEDKSEPAQLAVGIYDGKTLERVGNTIRLEDLD